MWKQTKDFPLPLNQIIIGYTGENGWVSIGIHLPGFIKNTIDSTMGVGVHPIKWWHPIPNLPWKGDYEEWTHAGDWIDCKDFPAPSLRDDALEFILFDEEVGIAEAEHWNGNYQSDTWSCKCYFKKPLFWCPFPILPEQNINVLQW